MGDAADIKPLALDALALVQNGLLVNLRFMSTAFARLTPLPLPGATFATDGAHLRFDPAWWARLYARDTAEASRAYLHVVLHNVFLHLYPGEGIEPALWDIACDMVVESVIDQLDLPATRTPLAVASRPELERMAEEAGLMTAERVYAALRERRAAGASEDELARLAARFYVDDHSPWHAVRIDEGSAAIEEGEAAEGDGHRASPAAAAATSGTDMDIPEEAADAPYAHKAHRAMAEADITQKEAPQNAAVAAGPRLADTVQLDRSREQWENAALEMGIQLDAYARLWGIEGANLAMNLRKVTREKQDYRAFLRKFARMGEQIRVNNDEFDYVFYTYGLSLYGNLPLVEPVEFAEEKRIRDFVIAIDTSASTKDGLVRRFIERTYSILADETSFFSEMNVLIIQCDAAITHVARIRSLRDLDRYLDDLEIRGLGGTDFRPVFTYVDAALAAGELDDLGGLIYFTDGQGTYPKRRPAYETAFVFLDSDDAACAAPVPPWAMKVVLDETFVLEEEPL
ncbi:VWA-like domain-containing protein [uncultured Adlercreutzia sp.]|uniref:vWA domain-containing protein n=1 Tax=uncultured Adlercreutzia sp. TaxID=875803 RepID=UPI0026F3E6CB|nr:VWA-like domain-containing protein [uncultured Adlercreutzia sp.]